MPGPPATCTSTCAASANIFPLVHQRILQCLAERVVRAVIGIGFTEAEQATAVFATQRSQKIVKTDADESRALNQIYNRAHTLADRDIGDSESLMNSSFGRNDRSEEHTSELQ